MANGPATASNADAALALIDLTVEAERIKSADHGASGKVTRPVISLPGLRVLLVSMRAGCKWPDHSTTGRITVQPVIGEIQMHSPDRSIALKVGQVAAFAANVTHDVLALTDAVFLLTVARPSMD